jgi:hypothetical protein
MKKAICAMKAAMGIRTGTKALYHWLRYHNI